MGIIQFAIKAALAAFFVFAAVYTYSLGEQRGAIEDRSDSAATVLHPLKTETVRADLIASVQEDALGDFDEQISLLTARAPLDELPYEIELAKALSLGDVELARSFADQAMARQPRSLAARLFALSIAAQAGNFTQVIDDYERLIELRAIDRNTLSDALIGVFRASGDWSALVEYLKTAPATGQGLVRKLMNESVAAADLQSLIALYPEQQSHYLDRLVRDGAYLEAYEAWQTFTGVMGETLDEIPFNPTFEEQSAPPPFNWLISRDRAEFQSRGGLYITYLGTERPLMARQIVSAPPGDYELSTQALGRMPEDGGSLEWILSCLGSNTQIANSRIELQTISQPEQFEITLTIPDEDCAFQRLDLWGRSGAFPKTSRTEILSVSLSKFSE